jgi:hypothetical protein
VAASTRTSSLRMSASSSTTSTGVGGLGRLAGRLASGVMYLS